MTYPTWDAAAKRVGTLTATQGTWPGIVAHPDGTFDLTYDPDLPVKDNADAS